MTGSRSLMSHEGRARQRLSAGSTYSTSSTDPVEPAERLNALDHARERVGVGDQVQGQNGSGRRPDRPAGQSPERSQPDREAEEVGTRIAEHREFTQVPTQATGSARDRVVRETGGEHQGRSPSAYPALRMYGTTERPYEKRPGCPTRSYDRT